MKMEHNIDNNNEDNTPVNIKRSADSRTKGTKAPQPLDLKIGQHIYRIRVAKGLSRQDLAGKLGITHQQLQKYEHGVNRISVSRLADIAAALEVNIHHFLPEYTFSEGSIITLNPLAEEVLGYLARVKDQSLRIAIRNLVKKLAHEE